jgi:hypothetical protein
MGPFPLFAPPSIPCRARRSRGTPAFNPPYHLGSPPGPALPRRLNGTQGRSRVSICGGNREQGDDRSLEDAVSYSEIPRGNIVDPVADEIDHGR